MVTNKSAIIIGAGVGGIATSVFLSQQGYKVRVYEKNLSPGGRCGQILRDGHRFDLGATILLMPNLYRDIFKSIGYDFDECLETKPVETLYNLFFEDGKELLITRDLSKMEDQLESIEEGSFKKLQSYLKKGYRLYEISFEKLLGKNFTSALQFINIKNIFLLFKLKAFINHNRYIRKYFQHPHLKMAFTFQNIYIGQSPYEAPALFSMLPSIELKEGSCFMKGGMSGVVTKLMDIAQAKGVEFYFGKPIAKIKVNKTTVSELILEDGSVINADVVIANADLPYIYRKLLPENDYSHKIDKMNYSCSAFVFHWGMDKVYSKLGLHNVILSDNYKDNLDMIFHKKLLSAEPDFYIYAPVRIDKTAAPEGSDSLSVIVPVGHIDNDRNQDWDGMEKMAKSYVIKRLNKILTDNIEEHIKFEISILPTSWENQCNVTKGGVFGSLGHNIMQMGYFRPHNRHDVYKNLYFVGGSTHPGSGVPMVLLSAKLVSERILSGK